MDESAAGIGRRLREIRGWRGLSLRAAGELAGFTASYLSKIELGQRVVDRRSTLEALAGALKVSPAELAGTPYPPSDAASSEAHASISVLRLAVTEMELGEAIEADGRPRRPLPVLYAELAEVSVLRQSCDFAGLGRMLPALLHELHAHLHAPGDGSRREVLIGLVDCYGAARAACKHLGVPDLAQIAARHIRDATEMLSGPEWTGLAAWSRAQAIGPITRDGALSVATRAADELSGELDRPEVAEVYGSLHLVAAFESTILGHLDDASGHLAEATETAARTGSGTNFAELYFGPVNVETWRVALAVEQGEGGKAAEIARTIDPRSLPASGERQSAFYLDLGRGLAIEKPTREQAVTVLRRAEDLAPLRVRANPFVRETVSDLLRRVKRKDVARELRGMAYRMGISP